MFNIEKKLEEFSNEVYGQDDALFDRNGNNVSTQVENFIRTALEEQQKAILEDAKKALEYVMPGDYAKPVIQNLRSKGYNI